MTGPLRALRSATARWGWSRWGGARWARARFLKPPAARLRSRPAAIVVALTVLAGGLAVVLWPREERTRVSAYFPRTVGIYPGSDVRVLGVRIGEVTRIRPQGTRVRVDLEYDAGRDVPADAKAAIINSSVVSDRYVQLLPVYRGGPRMRSGDVIPQRRTAVPVELDRIFDSLHDTAEALGPKGANKDGALSRLLGASADNLDGQGRQLHRTVEDLSLAVTTLSDGRGDLFATVRNLQVFTAALAADDDSVRSFNDSLAKVAEQLSGERKDLAAALRHLSLALGDVADFVHDNRKALTENVKGLSRATRVLVKQRAALEELLDVMPTGLANLNNAYDPAAGALGTRANPDLPQDAVNTVCALLRTAGERTDCKALAKLLDPLPDLPLADPLTGAPKTSAGARGGTPPSIDRTLGGILGAAA